MITFTFAKRCFKEIIRDQLSSIFLFFLPLLLLWIFTQINIPAPNYQINNLTPSIIIFSFSFVTLFTSTLVAKDHNTFFLSRLKISPMKPIHYILGYTLAIIPIIIVQNLCIYGIAILLNFSFSFNILFAILLSFIISIIFIEIGIIIGILVSDKAAPGVSSVIIQFVCFTSNIFFDTNMISKEFNTICKFFPFSSCVELLKSVLTNTYNSFLINILKIICYLIIQTIILYYILRKKSK